MRAVLGDERGAVAVVAALSLAVLLGASAFAVDLGHHRLVKGRMQAAVDAAALAAVRKLDEPTLVAGEAIGYAARNVPTDFGAITTAADVEIGTYDTAARLFAAAAPADANAVRVTAERSVLRGNAAPRILSAIFGKEAATIRATAIAARQLVLQYHEPEVEDLNPNAGDFNEMYAYCFDYKGTGPVETRRSQMTLIANNDPTGAAVIASGGIVQAVPRPIVWPKCERGESLSFRQRNIRHAKSIPTLWANPDATICISNCGKATAVNRKIGRAEHNHYTDTRIEGGAEFFNLEHNVLETIRCDSTNCAQELANGTIPQGLMNRTPNRESRPCMPGKYMYFGWEDRPPSAQGRTGHWTDPLWTDTDYDDIRIILKCPSTGVLGDGMVRLVQ